MELLIEADNVVRRFPGCEALGGVSFHVRQGEKMALLGPNGSGKTTTLRILATVLAPTDGRVRLAGLDGLQQSLAVRRRIAFVPENLPVYPEMRVGEYLAFRGRLWGFRGARLSARMREVVEQCGLGDVARRPMGVLSRGLRQRVGLADGLLHEPSIFLLDEPFAGLDPAQVEGVHSVLKGLGPKRCVLFSTHVLAEAERLCDRALILNGGRVAALEAPARLLQAGESSLAAAYRRLTTPLPLVRNLADAGRSA